MMTIAELYKQFVKNLRTIYDGRESENIADWVFENIADSKRLSRITNKEQIINTATIGELNIALQQLLKHKPVQYVLGEAWFYKMKLKVNEDVLIPRPETEELIEWLVEEFRCKDSGFKILDIGTGSGCIAIALKKEITKAEVFAIDISEKALEVAKQNAKDQKVNIQFLMLDFLDEALWKSLPLFNIIISNPPYIPENEKVKIAKNVLEHEPHIALFVNENDPFIFYKKIAEFAESNLLENGKIFVEVHEDYAKEVQEIFSQKYFKTIIKKDLYGRERMICAYR